MLFAQNRETLLLRKVRSKIPVVLFDTPALPMYISVLRGFMRCSCVVAKWSVSEFHNDYLRSIPGWSYSWNLCPVLEHKILPTLDLTFILQKGYKR